MFERLGVRNNLVRLLKSNFSLYRILMVGTLIYYEIRRFSPINGMENAKSRFNIIFTDIFWLFFLPLVVSIIILIVNHLSDKIKNKKLGEEYRREMLKEASCVELTFLDDNNVELKKDIVATLLELNLKKKIKFVNGKVMVLDGDTASLSNHEKYVLNKLIQSDKILVVNNYSNVGKLLYTFKIFFNIIVKKFKINRSYINELLEELKRSKCFEEEMDESCYRKIIKKISKIEYRCSANDDTRLRKDAIKILLKLCSEKKIRLKSYRISVLERNSEGEESKESEESEESEKFILNMLKSKKKKEDSFLVKTVRKIFKNDEFEENLLSDLKESKIIKQISNKSEKIYRKIKTWFLLLFAIMLVCLGYGDILTIIVWCFVLTIFNTYVLVKSHPMITDGSQSNWSWFCHMFLIGVGLPICITALIVGGSALIYISVHYPTETLITLKYIFLSIIAVNIIIEAILILKNKRSLTKKGKKIKKQLCEIKVYLNDFSTMKTKEINEIGLWDEYIIYSVILNENKKITRKVWEMLKNTIGNN